MKDNASAIWREKDVLLIHVMQFTTPPGASKGWNIMGFRPFLLVSSLRLKIIRNARFSWLMRVGAGFPGKASLTLVMPILYLYNGQNNCSIDY